MSSIAALPSLNVLQASFATSLAGVPAASAEAALADLRQVPAFSGLSSLADLASQDNITRLLFRPSFLHKVTDHFVFHGLDALRAVMVLPSIKERLGASAAALDLRHGVQTYSALLVFNDRPDALDVVKGSMSRALKDELNWPEALALENLGSFAVSVRKAFDVRADHLTGEQRHDLMQIAARLNEAAADLCAYDAAQKVSPIQARKIATLAELLYGSGFGDDRWQDVADGLHRLTRKWGKLDAASREESLRRSALLVQDMLEEVKASYRQLFDPITSTPAYHVTGELSALERHLKSLIP